jgi:hypothetical protein
MRMLDNSLLLASVVAVAVGAVVYALVHRLGRVDQLTARDKHARKRFKPRPLPQRRR